MREEIGAYRKAAVDAVNAAFEAGRRQGIAEERARVKALLDADPSRSPAALRRERANTPQSYGDVMSAVRPALREIGEAIDARGIADLIGGDITESQCRNALRQLERNGEAVRAARGKYLWRGDGGTSAGQKTDVRTS
jgi:hypothetical protein